MTTDNRTFRPERFISQGDEEFNNDWEILESEENSGENTIGEDPADEAVMKTQSNLVSARKALLEVANNMRFGQKNRG